jgi:hypothetical protein
MIINKLSNWALVKVRLGRYHETLDKKLQDACSYNDISMCIEVYREK